MTYNAGKAELTIRREWAMPNKATFSIKPIENLVKRVVLQYRNEMISTGNALIIDPFSNGRRGIADITNDLNPDIECDYNMDALDFLRIFDPNSVDGVLFDPPYSPRQVSECYKKLDKTVNMETTQASFWGNMKREIGRIVKNGGFCITCGWNSGGIGKKYGFEIQEILIVAHGGWHNDTIVTVERKL